MTITIKGKAVGINNSLRLYSDSPSFKEFGIEPRTYGYYSTSEENLFWNMLEISRFANRIGEECVFVVDNE